MKPAFKWTLWIGGGLLLAAAIAVAVIWVTGDGARPSDFRLKGEVPAGGPQFRLAVYQTTRTLFTDGNAVEVIADGAVFERIADELQRAKSSVNIVLFIWRPGPPGDRFVKLLQERVAAGVSCRVLVDPVGSAGFEEKVQPALEKGGCEVGLFRPLPTEELLARNHRKLVVIDGKVAFTGGFGFQDVWLGSGRSEHEWLETSARVEGPVVAQLQQAFAENWQETKGTLLPAEDFPALAPVGTVAAGFVTSTAHPELSYAERLVQLLARSAKKRLWIAQAYFTPTEPLLNLLIEKARAGVDVRVLMPGDRNDQPSITVAQRQTYPALRDAGVRLWEWKVSMLHSKTFVVDDRVAAIGSINFDPLSYRWLEEGSLVVDDPAVNGALAKLFEDVAGRSEEIK